MRRGAIDRFTSKLLSVCLPPGAVGTWGGGNVGDTIFADIEWHLVTCLPCCSPSECTDVYFLFFLLYFINFFCICPARHRHRCYSSCVPAVKSLKYINLLFALLWQTPSHSVACLKGSVRDVHLVGIQAKFILLDTQLAALERLEVIRSQQWKENYMNSSNLACWIGRLSCKL